MDPDAPDPADRPVPPPQAEAGPGLLRWAVAAVALVLLVVGAWQAYEWLAGDVARRRAAAEQGVPAPQAAASHETASAALVAQPAPPARPSTGGEPPAPAVVGGAINKCVLDGQVTYTNAPCPEGSSPAAVGPAGVDPNGVAGSTGESAAVAAVRPVLPSGADDPSQHEAGCNFLLAEFARLDYEFHQPLPPAVLDYLSTRLAGLRAQAGPAGCALPPRAAASAPAKMMVEKAAR
ncbi:MAG TPA: hypothetical protein PLY54_06910 [Ottowia sp.]|nr:hypothetical protein [Ottowia sp.]